jgi:hypothetical protein
MASKGWEVLSLESDHRKRRREPSWVVTAGQSKASTVGKSFGTFVKSILTLVSVSELDLLDLL